MGERARGGDEREVGGMGERARGGDEREVGGIGDRARGGEAWPVEDCFEDCLSIAGARRFSLEGLVFAGLLMLGLWCECDED
jgi:hypothetical protein